MDDRLVQDSFVSGEQMAIVERCEDFLNYVYPIAHNISRRDAILRDVFLKAALALVRTLIEAGKSSQISKLYAADAGLATLRFHLRFMAHKDRKLISQNQHRTASVLLAEVGKMLGQWINKTKAAQKDERGKR